MKIVILLVFLFSFFVTVEAQKDSSTRYSEYEPNYFLTNFGQDYYGQVKFKISFKYDLGIRDSVNKLFFAYSQFAFWDLYKSSAPMRELDFTPMLWYQRKINKFFGNNKWQIKPQYLRFGFLHQSNGQTDSLNRSLFKIF